MLFGSGALALVSRRAVSCCAAATSSRDIQALCLLRRALAPPACARFLLAGEVALLAAAFTLRSHFDSTTGPAAFYSKARLSPGGLPASWCGGLLPVVGPAAASFRPT